MQLDLTDNELVLIGRALKNYANYALEYSQENEADLVQLEYIGRCLCSKVLKTIDYSKVPNGIENLFNEARQEFCGIADDAALGSCCIMGGMNDEGLDITAKASIKDKKQRECFKANYMKILEAITKNMEQYK